MKGYHCWAEFYVKGKGWIPVDRLRGLEVERPDGARRISSATSIPIACSSRWAAISCSSRDR